MNFLQDLNTGNNSRLTTSVWDANVAQWMQKIQTHVQSLAGIWIPLALDANGYLKTSVKDSALPAGATTAAKQDTIITYIDTLETLLTATNGYVDGVEALLTAIRDTSGIKKITDAVDIGDRAGRLLGKVTADVTLLCSSLDLRGLAANKPLATAVQIGATYWSVDTDPNADAIEVSNGTDWSVMA